MKIPLNLRRNIISIYSHQGEAWLNELPELLNKYVNEWKITFEDCYSNASFNYVAPATCEDGTKAVLKCSVPNIAFSQEIAALKAFRGLGSVKLLCEDDNAGVMLLEKAEPGTILETVDDLEQATSYAVSVMHKLHHYQPKADDKFPDLAEWFLGFNKLYEQFDGKTGPFPEKLIDKAKKISNDLLISMNKRILLHGDLHYANILQSGNSWTSIDPKGVIGEPEYEIPLPRLTYDVNKKILLKRLNCFIDISGFDRQRIMHWIFVKAVLAAWWSFEDSKNIHKPFIDCAVIISEILK